MDPDNPIVKLCLEGMRAEGQGRYDDARALFTQAWEASTDDFDACVAAHYLARRQESPEDTLYWNQEALNRADAVGDERVRAFYPSLYLNMGYSYEKLGNRAEASRYYELAAGRIVDLPEGAYADLVRGGIAEGLKRIAS
jgi:tetratricopeptide (TPR) repeat protein